MFEKAARMKLRFATARGTLSVEDLWVMPLEAANGFSLDDLAHELFHDVEDGKEKSFVRKKSKTDATAVLRFEIVKHIIGVKLEETEQAKKRAKNNKEIDELVSILAEKDSAAKREMSSDEIKKKIKKLTNK